MLRRIVLVPTAGAFQRFTGSAEAVARQLQLVAIVSHDIYRPDMPMHEAFSMKVSKDVQNGIERLAGLFRRKRPAGKHLRKIFLGALHHNVKHRYAVNLAASLIENGNQVRMRKLTCRAPSRELNFISFSARGDQFNSGPLRPLTLIKLGEKYSTVLGAAKVSKQRELPVDYLALPPFPVLRHDSTPALY
jgi:hypothetical protein